MPITRDIVEKKLWWPLADPYRPIDEDLYLRSDDSTDAAGLEKWYRALSSAEQGAVREVVFEWLSSGDRKKTSRALWFVGSVDPAQVFLPSVEGLASQLDKELGPGLESNLMFLRFLDAVGVLNAVSVVPYLKRWAEHIDGPTFDWASTGLVALSGLLRLDRDAALALTDRVVRSSGIYTHPLYYSSLIEDFVGCYARTRPDELEPLAKALSDATPEVKEKAISCVKDQLEVLVSIGMRKSDWTREAVQRFARTLRASKA